MSTVAGLDFPREVAQPTTECLRREWISLLRAAEERLSGIVLRTPMIDAPVLKGITGRNVLLKLEILQREGSFKFRGALNRLKALKSNVGAEHVVACSSGNHAGAVAAAARLLGMRATVVIPYDAPQAKISAVRSHDAEVVFYDRARDDREAIGSMLAARLGAALVPSYDDPDIIAGQGTVGAEILGDATLSARPVSQLVVPCGGGGLAAGCAIASWAAGEGAQVFCVEPRHFDDMGMSLTAGARICLKRTASSICDGLQAKVPGQCTFQVLKDSKAEGLVVSDAEVTYAVWFAFRHLRVVVEPSGAVALAALLAGRVPPSDGHVCVILSGGNVDERRFGCILGDCEGGKMPSASSEQGSSLADSLPADVPND